MAAWPGPSHHGHRWQAGTHGWQWSRRYREATCCRRSAPPSRGIRGTYVVAGLRDHTKHGRESCRPKSRRLVLCCDRRRERALREHRRGSSRSGSGEMGHRIQPPPSTTVRRPDRCRQRAAHRTLGVPSRDHPRDAPSRRAVRRGAARDRGAADALGHGRPHDRAWPPPGCHHVHRGRIEAPLHAG